MKRRTWFGIDRFEVVIQALVTFAVGALAGNAPGRTADYAVSAVIVSSLLFLAWRRRKALSAEPEIEGSSERMEDLEYRVADLEQAQQRVLELEERLDFAERLLARQRSAEQLPEAR